MLIKRGKLYYLRLFHGGKETWISTFQTTERAAQKVADRIESEFDRERQTRRLSSEIVEVAKQLARKEIDISDARRRLAKTEQKATEAAMAIVDMMIPAPPLLAAELWAAYERTSPELKESSLVTKKQRFGRFEAWAGERDMRGLDHIAARKFLDTLEVTAQTRNNYISELSSVFKASPDVPNPWGEALRQRTDVKNKQPFTIDQVRELLAYCKAHDHRFWHTAVMLAYYTGLRLKDVVFFSREQITEDGYIDLIPQKTERTKKRIRIKLNSQLAEELRGVVSIGPQYFPEQVARYNEDRGHVSRAFQNILKGAGIDGSGIGFHSLRHTFVTEALNAGIDIKQVQAAVGHEAIKVTEGIYYHGKRNADWGDYPGL